MRLAVMAALNSAVLSDAAQRGADRLLLLGIHDATDRAQAIADQIGRSLRADLELLTVGSLPPGLGPLSRRPPAWACGALPSGDLSALSEVPEELVRAGVVMFDVPGVGATSRTDDEYRAAAATVLAARPAASICIGMFEHAPTAVTVARDGTVIRADHAITACINVEQLTFVSPGGLGRRREDVGPVGWAALDSEANTIELHSVRYENLASVEHDAGAVSLDPHTSRVAAELRAWLSGLPQHAA